MSRNEQKQIEIFQLIFWQKTKSEIIVISNTLMHILISKHESKNVSGIKKCVDNNSHLPIIYA